MRKLRSNKYGVSQGLKAGYVNSSGEAWVYGFWVDGVHMSWAHVRLADCTLTDA